jgi:hypothetical protein
MVLGEACGARLKAERERIGLSARQLAALAGVSDQLYASFEAGQIGMPFDFSLSLRRFGIRPEVLGGLEQGELPKDEDALVAGGKLVCWSTADFSDSFPMAVRLMQRSIQAVDAFVAEGAAKQCPQLVAALMEATIRLDYSSGAGEREELVDKIENGLQLIAKRLEEIRDTRSGSESA